MQATNCISKLNFSSAPTLKLYMEAKTSPSFRSRESLYTAPQQHFVEGLATAVGSRRCEFFVIAARCITCLSLNGYGNDSSGQQLCS